jgi:hypothetical protein
MGSSKKERFKHIEQAHDPTVQKDLQRCEVAMLDQIVNQLNPHLLAYVVPLRSAKKKGVSLPAILGAEF